MDIQAIQSH